MDLNLHSKNFVFVYFMIIQPLYVYSLVTISTELQCFCRATKAMFLIWLVVHLKLILVFWLVDLWCDFVLDFKYVLHNHLIIDLSVLYAPSIRLYLPGRESLKLDMREVDKLVSMSSLQKRWVWLSCLLLLIKWTNLQCSGQKKGFIHFFAVFTRILSVLICNYNESPCCWYTSRYEEIESKMVPFLKQSGYNVKKGKLPLFFCLRKCWNFSFLLF